LLLATAADADRTSVRTLAITASSAISLVLHGSVLAAVLLFSDPEQGAIELPTEAISVEIVPSDVLESAHTSPSPEATASASSVQSDPGATDNAAASSSAQPEAVEQVAEPVPTSPPVVETTDNPSRSSDVPMDVLDVTPESDEPAFKQATASAEPEEPSPPTATPPQPVVEKKKHAPQPQPRKVHKEASRKGGAPSRAAQGSAASSARVSASPGAVINYAAVVRARVASRRPAGPGKHGTVVVTFGVSRSGGLAFASISRSSGDAGLDRTVLSAVRSAAPFPTPPPGASPGQLRFSMPFYFQ